MTKRGRTRFKGKGKRAGEEQTLQFQNAFQNLVLTCAALIGLTRNESVIAVVHVYAHVAPAKIVISQRQGAKPVGVPR